MARLNPPDGLCLGFILFFFIVFSRSGVLDLVSGVLTSMYLSQETAYAITCL